MGAFALTDQLMRLSTLLITAFLLTPLTAQRGFTADQRAELRAIIRSELRAAIREFHAQPAHEVPRLQTPRGKTIRVVLDVGKKRGLGRLSDGPRCCGASCDAARPAAEPRSTSDERKRGDEAKKGRKGKKAAKAIRSMRASGGRETSRPTVPFANEDLPPEWKRFVERNRAYFSDDQVAGEKGKERSAPGGRSRAAQPIPNAAGAGAGGSSGAGSAQAKTPTSQRSRAGKSN